MGSDENIPESEPDPEVDPFELFHDAHFMQLLMAQLRPQQGIQSADKVIDSMDWTGREYSSQANSEID